MMSTCRTGLVLVLVFCLLGSACGGSESASDDPAATPEPDAAWTPSPSSTAVPEPSEPTVVPTPAATPTPRAFADNDVLRAAVDAYEAAPLPEGTRSFDVLDRSIDVEGNVRLTVCTWDGASVENRVVDVVVEIAGTDAADLAGEVTSAQPVGGSCITSDLLEAAIEFIDEEQIGTAAALSTIAPWTDRRLPSDLLVAPAWRGVDAVTLDVGYCVEMHPDAPVGEAGGDHVVRWVRLDFDVDARPQWAAVQADHLSSQDCRAAASWPRLLIDWQPGGIWRVTE